MLGLRAMLAVRLKRKIVLAISDELGWVGHVCKQEMGKDDVRM